MTNPNFILNDSNTLDRTTTDDIPLQLLLSTSIAKAWQRPYYRQLWDLQSVNEAIELVQSNQFHTLPVIRKSHLRAHFDDLMVFDGAVDLISSSGTTGRPVDIPVHHAQEMGRVLRVRRLLRELGVRQGSKVLQLLSLNDLFTLGVLAWQAIKAEGATAIRCSPSRIDRILDVIQYNRPEVVIGNPFVMVRIAEEAGDRWPDQNLLPDKAFFAVAATFDSLLHRTPVANKAIELWKLNNYLNQYGTSEVGPIAYEKNDHSGLYIHDDFNYVELVDPVTGIPVKEGEPGEVVITGLTFPRGFIPVRYGTGDISAWLTCTTNQDGKSHSCMGPIIGRTDHQLKIFGQTVFPDLLMNLADQIPLVERSAVAVHRDPLSGDVVTILCVTNKEANAEDIAKQVHSRCVKNLAVAPSVQVVSNSYLNRLQQEALAKTNGSKVPRFFEIQQEQLEKQTQ